jgi:Leucine-rich repeat (LRR) protein
MKHVKLTNDSDVHIALTEEQISWLNECTLGSWELNESTGLVDVEVGFNCMEQNLTDFKGVKFGHVSGDFRCGLNQLESLEGAPQSVRSFYCNDNRLTSLNGAPKTVHKYFYCNDNLLTSLAGAPQTVTDLYCHRNQLTSLEGAPLNVSNLHCHGNPVSTKTLESVFEVMKSEKSYQQSLIEYWPEMDNINQTLDEVFDYNGPCYVNLKR